MGKRKEGGSALARNHLEVEWGGKRERENVEKKEGEKRSVPKTRTRMKTKWRHLISLTALSPVVLSPAFLRKPLPHEQQWVAAKNEHQKSCAFRILAHISLQLLFYDL